VSKSPMRIAALVAFALLCVALPFVFPPFRVSQFTIVIVYAIATLGLTVLTGYAGAVSVGHGAFFAVGAYCAAILVEHAGWPYLATLPVAGLVAGAGGYAFGRPALRIRGLYLALLTLALAVVVPPLVARFEGLTGGTQGLVVGSPEAPGWTGLAADQWIYFVALAVAVPMFVFARNAVRSGPGRALLAAADNDVVAGTLGVDVSRYRTAAFVMGTTYAGVAGGLYTLASGFVSPGSFTLTLSLLFMSALVVGGLRSVAGAVYGALFIEFVPLYAGDVDPGLSGVLYGAALLLVIFLVPGGLAELLRAAWARVAGARRHREAVPARERAVAGGGGR
jgi:branched-chain amino acid transport system permease protein